MPTWEPEIVVDEPLARGLLAQLPELELDALRRLASGWDYTVFVSATSAGQERLSTPQCRPISRYVNDAVQLIIRSPVSASMPASRRICPTG